MWNKALDDIKKVTTPIKERHPGQFVMEHSRKDREIEIQMDVKDDLRNISLIRSPAAGLKERRA